jgi:hypothetical protein
MNSQHITGVTGKKARISGIYRSENQFIPLSKYETFPPSSSEPVIWTLVVNV